VNRKLFGFVLSAAVLLSLKPLHGQGNPFTGEGVRGSDTSRLEMQVDPINGDSLLDTEVRAGAEQTGTCTGVWASWRGLRGGGRRRVILELVVRWGSDVAAVPTAIDSSALLGRRGAVAQVPVTWTSEPRYWPATDYTAPQWRQSIALATPDTLLAVLEHGPVVVGLSGRSAQATYSCRAKLPDEIPGDLTTLRAALR
jgi:hypothetical protein